MNKDLKELIDLYKKKEGIDGIYLTTYLENNYKILELNLLFEELENSEENARSLDYADNFKITTSFVTSKDLELKEENERNLVKLANSSIIYDSDDKLSKLKKEIIRIMDSENLASMYNEITFYQDDEIVSKIGK